MRMDRAGFIAATMASTSSTKSTRPSRRTTAVIELRLIFKRSGEGASTCFQLIRWMRVTPETRNAVRVLLNSVMITRLSLFLTPPLSRNLLVSISGTILPSR